VTREAPPRPIAFAWMATSALLFAAMNFFARLASSHVSWTVVAMTRALVGGIVAIAVARIRVAPMRVRDRRGIWGRSLWGTGAMGCTFYALSCPDLPLGDAATLLNLTPVFLALLTPIFLGERSGRRVAFALPLSLGGAVLILHPPFLFGGASAMTAAAHLAATVAVVGALSSSFAMMMLRRIGPYESPEAIAIHFSLTAAALLGVLALPHLGDLARAAPRDLGVIVLAGLSAGLAQICMTRAYSLERAARVSGVGYLAVVGSALLGAAALHEWPTAPTLLGMALVIAGGLVVTLLGLREHRRAPGPLKTEPR
jgi:drug/metabolite transporter (DMT)-like permease